MCLRTTGWWRGGDITRRNILLFYHGRLSLLFSRTPGPAGRPASRLRFGDQRRRDLVQSGVRRRLHGDRLQRRSPAVQPVRLEARGRQVS